MVEPAPVPAPEPAPEPVPPAGPPPVVRTEPEAPEQPRGQTIDDIRREAEQKAIELKQMEAFKLLARGRMLAEADYRQLHESYQKAQEQRIPFRNDLRLLVETLGNQAGTEISQLCSQYGRSTAPKIREGVVNDLRHASARMTRQASVETMRPGTARDDDPRLPVHDFTTRSTPEAARATSTKCSSGRRSSCSASPSRR